MMLMSAMNPHAEEIKRLQLEVERGRTHLAEVVDEFVFVEGEKSRIEKQLAQSIQLRDVEDLVRVVERLSAYTLNLEQHVIAPALGSLSEGYEQCATARKEALATAEHAAGDNGVPTSLSPVMQRAFSSLRQGPDFAAATLRRQQIVSGPPLTSLDDAYVMCVSMLAAKQQLTASVADIQRTWDSWSTKMKQGTVAAVAGSAEAVREANRRAESAVADQARMAESVRLLEDAVRGSGNSGGDIVRMTQRLRELEQAVAQHEVDRSEVAQRFVTLQGALEAAGRGPVDAVPRASHDLVAMQLQHQARTLQQAQEESASARKELAASRKEWGAERRQLESTIEGLRVQLAEKQRGTSAEDMDSFIRALQRPTGGVPSALVPRPSNFGETLSMQDMMQQRQQEQ
jgi:hypothetical protein